MMQARTGALAVLALVLAAAGVFAWQQAAGSTEEHFNEAAIDVIQTCKDAEYRPSCYDKEIPKLMGAFSMEDVFSITQLIQRQDASYPYCHVLGHELAAQEVQKDPSNWKGVAARCPTNLCSNGCIHGAFQERFRAEAVSLEQAKTLAPEFAQLCEVRPGFSPSGITQASCYHAVGHLLMYVTSADVPTAIGLCKEVALKDDGRDYSQVCYDGVFMQIFQPLEPEDIALVKGMQPTKEQVPAFCSPYEGAPRASCISESWPLFAESLLVPTGPSEFCALEEIPHRQRCFKATFSIVMAQLGLDGKRMDEYCAATPENVRDLCYENGASRLIQTDTSYVSRAVGFCDLAAQRSEGDACYRELATHAGFNLAPNSPEFSELCALLPEQWRNACRGSAHP